MREIKFRGYSENGSWTYMKLKGDRWDISTFPLKKGTILNPQEWQQFTGLLDRNGKEIYEGDIVQYKGSRKTRIAEIVFWEDKLKFCKRIIGRQSYSGLRNPNNLKPSIEVIGNIYETPELLSK